MRGRLRRVSSHRVDSLTTGWQIACCAPGTVDDVVLLDAAALDWIDIARPQAAAACLRDAGLWSLDAPARDFDAVDWWYRASFDAAAPMPNCERFLCLDGLATLAEVWLNGQPLLSSDNMFVAHERPVDGRLVTGRNTLVIRCRALQRALETRKPRPKWRVPMAAHQQLRWHRTTLLGRTPGWSPSAACVGPWREVRIEHRQRVGVADAALRTHIDGDAGVLHAALNIAPIGATRVAQAVLHVAHGTARYAVSLALTPSTQRHAADLVIPNVERWWPHTHGEPALYAAWVRIDLDAGGESIDVDLGQIGFRTVELCTDDGGFALRINGVDVFCRGACWTPIDVVALDADARAVQREIERVRDTGMNMLRVGGTMVYESDAFYDACDAAGVLVWQDLMFANFDYPFDDAAFRAGAEAEIAHNLARCQARPSLAIVCGNSEGAQQAAMWGAAREHWSPAWFENTARTLVETTCAGVPYWPSSAHGGAFPHQPDTGTTSYYGVGAYRRPLDDARRAGVRFASECLAFANVPEPAALARWAGTTGLKAHHPAWKARVPRDLGAGWDFDDVRDFYLASLYRVDPAALRAHDHERYLTLSRAVPADAMSAAFSEWRRVQSRCAGALIWFWRDLWMGPGWGVVDAEGGPKSAWYALRRVLQPVALVATDEGCNGVRLHAINERAKSIAAVLEIALYRAGEIAVGKVAQPIELGARSVQPIDVASCFDQFVDFAYAYRFGPPHHDMLVATLRDAAGRALAQAWHFPGGADAACELDIGLTAHTSNRDDGDIDLVIGTRRFARAVAIDVSGYLPDDNHFHVAPGAQHRVRLRAVGVPRLSRGTATALNAQSPARIEVLR